MLHVPCWPYLMTSQQNDRGNLRRSRNINTKHTPNTLGTSSRRTCWTKATQTFLEILFLQQGNFDGDNVLNISTMLQESPGRSVISTWGRDWLHVFCIDTGVRFCDFNINPNFSRNVVLEIFTLQKYLGLRIHWISISWSFMISISSPPLAASLHNLYSRAKRVLTMATTWNGESPCRPKSSAILAPSHEGWCFVPKLTHKCQKTPSM